MLARFANCQIFTNRAMGLTRARRLSDRLNNEEEIHRRIIRTRALVGLTSCSSAVIRRDQLNGEDRLQSASYSIRNVEIHLCEQVPATHVISDPPLRLSNKNHRNGALNAFR
jgi:hypothetical protein